jgi:hypothetical protein
MMVRCNAAGAASSMNMNGSNEQLYWEGDLGTVLGVYTDDMCVDWHNQGPLRGNLGGTRSWYIDLIGVEPYEPVMEEHKKALEQFIHDLSEA